MTKNKRNIQSNYNWRRLFLHPLFFDRLVYLFLATMSAAVLWLEYGSANHAITYWLLAFNFTLALIGFLHTLQKKVKPRIVHVGIVLMLITPTLYIIFQNADLRLAIFALPASNMLQLGLVSHKLNQRLFGVYNLILLVGLLIPMISTNVVITSESISVQIILVLIAIITISTLGILYIWHQSNAYLRTNEKKLIDRIDAVIQTFSNLLTEHSDIDTLLKKVAQNIIPTLELEDCVIYTLDEKGEKLIQKAAFGDKADENSQKIIDPIAIKVGEGVVGHVAKHGLPQIIQDTSIDKRYIEDDAFRFSELAVPIIIKDRVVGVIDSEHTQKYYFNEVHLYLMEIIASLCAAKMIEIQNYSIQRHSLELEIEAEKLKEINQAKTRFISNLSHDLKTPLTLILSPANELKKMPLEQEDRELVELINTNGKRLRHVIEELLQLNELAFLAQSAQFKTVDFGIMMHEWASGFKRRCQNLDIRFSISGEKSLQISTDKKKLTAIIYNLFDAILKMVQPGGLIRIDFERYDQTLKWRIIGLDGIRSNKPQEQKHLKHKLNQVKDLSDLLKADFYSTQTHEQISFEFTLDLTHLPIQAQNPAPSTQPAIVPTHHHEKPVVLVIEDHDELRSFMHSSLEQDFICTTAATGEAGIELAHKLIPDLIVTDLMLPGMNGEEVCRTLRSAVQLNHIPIIVLSAKSMTMDRVALYQLGAENYLTKPFDMNELKAIIQSTIEQRTLLIAQSKATFLHDNNTQPGDTFSEKLLDVIKENYSDSSFNVDALCHIMKIGRNQLQRRVKSTLDMTPLALIRHVRLKKAHDYMTDSTYSISEIAYKVGFSNLSYFSRAFKAKYKKSPSDIRTDPTQKDHE